VTWGARYWPWFLAIAVLGFFLVPEVYALVTNYRNTLSFWVWSTLRVNAGEPIRKWTALHYLAAGIYLVLVTWLTGHFFFRWWAS